MGAAYSQDLRDRVLGACDRGMATAEVARVFSVSRSWVRRIKQRRREFGQTTPRKMGGPGPIKIDRVRLEELVGEQPDSTLKELRDRLGNDCSESTLCMALQKMGLSLKKNAARERAGPPRRRRSACGLA